MQHAGGSEMLQPFLCGTIAQACHALQVTAGETGVGGEIVAAEVIVLRTETDRVAYAVRCLNIMFGTT